MPDDAFQRFLDHNKLYNFEGERGVRKLESLVHAAGNYDDLREFFADNSGAIQAVVEWMHTMSEQQVPEWANNLAEFLPALDEEDSEDDGQPDDAQEWHDFDPDA